jgi:hypothetical protein
MVSTSEGKALLIDGIHFGSFTILDSTITFREWVTSEEVVFSKIATI